MSIRITTLLLFLFASIQVFSQGYYIKNYDVNMLQSEDGVLWISENITVQYDEKRQGIIRDIPYIYNWQGKRVKVSISDIKVPGYKSKVTNKGSDKSIRIGTKGKYITGEHEYEITYKVEGHIAAYDDFLEFYWNPIPEDWDTRIESYNYTLELPNPIDLQYEDYKVFSGDQASTENTSTIRYANNTLSGRSTKPLKAKQGVTLAVKLPFDYLPVDLIAASAEESQSNRTPINTDLWTWMLSILGLLVTWMGWKSIDSNTKEERTISLQHYPPEDMSAAQVGFFIDHSAHARDIMSLLPQWGAEGLLQMDKIDDDTQINKIGDLPKSLPNYEHTLFDAIFKDGDRVLLSEMKYKLATALYKAQSQLSSEQKKSDLYDETSVMYFHSWRTILASVALIVSGILSIAIWKLLIIGIALILIGVFLFVIYFTTPKYTSTGIRIKNHLLGLEQFLKNHDGADYPALMKKDPKYFDKMFPYAVALGIDTNFLKVFGDRVDYSPQWYGDPNRQAGAVVIGNSMKSFSDNFDVKEITSVFSSVEPSSGGSGGGFSGGGSVGGGFGGGGGSSW